MKSYLLTALTRRFAQAPVDKMAVAHTHQWLVWEPGSWKPDNSGSTMMVSKDKLIAARETEALPTHKVEEALVIALESTAGERTLGRAPKCDLVINDATLSQIHLTFSQDAGVWLVKDAGSKNGSSINGVKLAPGLALPLRSGTAVLAGQVSLTYYDTAGLHARLQLSNKPA